MSNNGFSLAEMVAVIAIVMVLSLLSTPYVKGYIDDSYNGKAQIFLRQLNEARLNIERDYPGTTVSGNFSYDATGNCNIGDIYQGSDLTLSPDMLVKCKYVKVPTDLNGRYIFAVGGTPSCASCSSGTQRVYLKGDDKAGAYKNKCACIDNIGVLHKEAV